MSEPIGFDPLTIRLTHDLLVSVAEEMGEALVRSAASPNITERRDASCALFDREGRLVAQASHVPVHLGSLASSVVEARRLALEPGDMVLLNDPFRGGAHLPDLTLVAPQWLPGDADPAWYVATRAHHADIGGMAPGSMAPAIELYQEGLVIPPVRLVRAGAIEADLLALVLANTRTPLEREADLRAMIGANRVGGARLGALAGRRGAGRLAREAEALLDYSERRMVAVLAALPDGESAATDLLDDDGAGSGPVRLAVRLHAQSGRLVVDFAGSAPQTSGNVNAVAAVTRAALLYVLATIAGEELPVNAGLLRPVELLLPERSVVHAGPPAAVAAGNVETSQRIVDVLFLALAALLPDRIPAASAGTMNNVTFGGRRADGSPFTWYETIAGGHGAAPGAPGASCRHAHMTNTRNTSIEIIEVVFPVRLQRYEVLRDSGGAGLHRGGDGVRREFRFLVPGQVSLHADRRSRGPWGLCGGSDGRPGTQARVLRDGTYRPVAAKSLFAVEAGEGLVVETPGGGGWGPPVAGAAPPPTSAVST